MIIYRGGFEQIKAAVLFAPQPDDALTLAGSAAHGGSRHADILSRDYELEQTNLTNLVEYLRQEVKEQ